MLSLALAEALQPLADPKRPLTAGSLAMASAPARLLLVDRATNRYKADRFLRPAAGTAARPPAADAEPSDPFGGGGPVVAESAAAAAKVKFTGLTQNSQVHLAV
jgi:hypothetical protein